MACASPDRIGTCVGLNLFFLLVVRYTIVTTPECLLLTSFEMMIAGLSDQISSPTELTCPYAT